VITAWGSYCAVETAIAHESSYPARAAGYGGLARVIDAGRAMGAIDLMKAHHERLAFTGALATLFSEIDLLLVPTQPRADFTIAQEKELFATPGGLAGFLRFTTPYDMSGSPTITLPAGFTAKGLPLSVQLVGQHLDEGLLVRAGHAYQQATDWHRQHPAL
jgi:amidase